MADALQRFQARVAEVPGRVAAVLLDHEGREVLAIAPDEIMPAASVIKLPLVMALYADAAEGRIDLDQRVAVGPRVAGSGVLRHLGADEMSLRDLATLAMAVSDNTATNRLIEQVGVARVNERLDAWGCPRTRLRRSLFDLEARARGLENEMTARETASLLLRVQSGSAAGDAASSGVLELLERNSDLTRIGRYLSKGVALAHKDGWLEDPEPVDNDAGIVRAERSVVAVGFTQRIERVAARELLGVLGLAAAEIAGAKVALPLEASRSA